MREKAETVSPDILYFEVFVSEKQANEKATREGTNPTSNITHY